MMEGEKRRRKITDERRGHEGLRQNVKVRDRGKKS